MTAPVAMTTNYLSLQQVLSRFLFGVWPTSLPLTVASPFPTSDQINDINRCILEGLQSVYTPPPLAPGRPSHQWSFMRPTMQLTTTAPWPGSVTGATVYVTNGVVYFSDPIHNTWPANASQGTSLILNGSNISGSENGSFTVQPGSLNTGANTITLQNTTINVSSGFPLTFSLNYYAYPLPANFGGIEGPLTYDVGMSQYYPPIRIVKEVMIRKRRGDYELVMRPEIAAITPVPFLGTDSLSGLPTESADMTVGSQWQIEFYPTPDATYILTYVMKAMPFMLDASNLYPLGGATLSQVIEAGCLAAAERFVDSGPLIYSAKFNELLMAAVQADAGSMSPDSLGMSEDPSDFPGGYWQARLQTGALMTYNGQLYF